MLLFLLGILGILQATFLPGALITLWCVHEKRLTLFFPISFGLSLLANYLLVMLLVLANLYNQQTMILFIFVEFILFYVCYRAGYLNFISIHYQKFNYYLINYKELFDFKFIPYFIIAICFLCSCYTMSTYVGNVFTGWDAVWAWNKWSIDWSRGHFPSNDARYPQLLPISQSICYVLTGRTDIEFFSYIVDLFYYPLSILAIFVILTKNKLKFPAIFLSFIIFLTSIYYYDNNHIGLADIPIMVLSSFSITLLLFSQICKDKNSAKYIVISVAFAACAAITKRSGLLLFFIFLPLITYEFGLLFKYNKIFLKSYIFSLAIIVSPWYLYIIYDIHFNNFLNQVTYAYQNSHDYHEISYFQRVIGAIHNYPLPFYLSLLSLPAFFIKKFKCIALSGISGYLIWCLFFSYSIRNIAVAIPFLGLATGVSIPVYLNFVGILIYTLLYYFFNSLETLGSLIKLCYKKIVLKIYIYKIMCCAQKSISLIKLLSNSFSYKHFLFILLFTLILSYLTVNDKIENLIYSRQANMNLYKCDNLFLNSILLYTSKQNNGVFYGNYPSFCVPFLPNYSQIQYDDYIGDIPVYNHYLLLIKDNPSKSCPNEINSYRKCSVLLSENGFNLLHIK